MLTPIGGLLGVIGAVAYVVHLVVRSMLTAGVDPAVSARGALWVPANALGAVAAVLVLVGMSAVGARMAGRVGPAGLTGLALIAVSWMFFGVFLSLFGALVLPWLADEAPHLVAASAPTPIAFVVTFVLGMLGWLVGAALLTGPLVRAPVRHRWIGWVLLASALWALAGNLVIASGGPPGNLAVNLLSNLGPVLLMTGLGGLGLRAWAEHRVP